MNKRNLTLGKEPSKIREMFEFAKKQGNKDIFDFSIGNPSVLPPKKVDEVLERLLKDPNVHQYTSSAGDINVRDKIAEYLNKTYKTNIKGEFIYLTCGAAAALAISFNALLEKDDEVISFAPYFPEYKVFIEQAGGKFVPLLCKDDMLPDLDLLEKAINERTQIVLINSPNNPTGQFYDEEIIKSISSVLKKKEKELGHPIYLVSDEPYRELLFVDKKYPFITNYYDNSIVCYSFSKSLSLPGERIGYVLVNPNAKEVDDVFNAIKGAGRSLGYICAPSIFQKMIPEILGCHSDFNVYIKNRDLLYKSLTEIGYEVVKPVGAFYLFMKALDSDANEFAKEAIKYNLVIVPSDTFGIKGYVRIAYCVSHETVINSIEAFRKLYERYKNER